MLKEIQREDVSALRKSLSQLGVVIAEIDRELRYVWIENPHPDFYPKQVIGKRDDELIPVEEAAKLMALKQSALSSGQPVTRILRFGRSDDIHYYAISAYPIVNGSQRVDGLVTVAFNTPRKIGQRGAAD